jgi:hypothetical protein
MGLYWSLKSVPELATLGRKQRRQIHEQCLRRYFFSAPTTPRSVAAFAVALFTAIAFIILGVNLPPLLGLSASLWISMGSAGLGCGLGRFFLSRIAIPALRPYYREFLEGDNKSATILRHL